MTDKPDVIDEAMANSRRAIDESRAAITKKLGMLEDRVQETLDGVRQTFDLHHQVQAHPWLIVGGSVVAGYALGCLVAGAPAAEHISISPSSPAPQHQPVRAVRIPATDNFATIKREVYQVVIGTLWAMAKQILNVPSTAGDGAYTSQRSEPYTSPRADQGVPPRSNGHSDI